MANRPWDPVLSLSADGRKGEIHETFPPILWEKGKRYINILDQYLPPGTKIYPNMSSSNMITSGVQKPNTLKKR